MNRRSFIGMLAALPLVGRLVGTANPMKVYCPEMLSHPVWDICTRGSIWIQRDNDVYGLAENLREWVIRERNITGEINGIHLHCLGLGNCTEVLPHPVLSIERTGNCFAYDYRHVRDMKVSLEFPNNLSPEYQTIQWGPIDIFAADADGLAARKLYTGI